MYVINKCVRTRYVCMCVSVYVTFLTIFFFNNNIYFLYGAILHKKWTYYAVHIHTSSVNSTEKLEI